MTRTIALVLALAMPAAVFANGGTEEMPRRETETVDTCGAAQYADLMGQPYQQAEALEFEGPVRIFPHDAAVTMDYLPNRINFVYGPDGLIVRISCG